MKKRIFSFFLVLALVLAIPVYAEARKATLLVSLAFDGTTANCSASAIADRSADKIDMTIELYQGNTKVTSWEKSGSGSLNFRDTAKVTKGKTYTLKVYATINGVEYSKTSGAKTYN